MQFNLVDPLLGTFNDPRRLDEAIQSFDRLPECGVGLGEPHEQKWGSVNSSGSTECCEPLPEQRKAFL